MMPNSLITASYIMVPIWLMISMRKYRIWQWHFFGVALHLCLVAFRRGLVELGADDPALWSQIHGVTICIAGAGALYEAVRSSWR